MILTILGIWFAGATVFFGSLAVIASRPMPKFEDASASEDRLPTWDSVPRKPEFAAHEAVLI